MKSQSQLALIFIFLFYFSLTSFAQNKKKKDSFPTYEQIRGDKSETVDFVTPQRASNNFLPNSATPVLIRRTQISDPYMGAFQFSDDEAIFILNGKRMKNLKKAQDELAGKGDNIDRVSIGEVGQDGKRIIEIDYTLKEK